MFVQLFQVIELRENIKGAFMQVMTPKELNERLSVLVKQERQATNEILRLINLAQNNKAFLDLGFSSLFDWLVKGFGYSASAAQRRIEAARLFKILPEVSKKLEQGEVNLSTLSKASSIIQAQQKVSKQKLSPLKIKEVVEKIEGKSTFEAERALIQLFPEAAKTMQPERRQVVTADITRVNINLDPSALKDLDRVKEVLSHQLPSATDSEVISYALKFLLKMKDPLQKKTLNKSAATTKALQSNPQAKLESQVEFKPQAEFRSQVEFKPQIGFKSHTECKPQIENKPTTPAAEVSIDQAWRKQNTQVQKQISHQQVSIAQKRELLQRFNGQCTFKDPKTGRMCGGRYQVQIDHIRPRALGGTNAQENLRPLCRQHNLLAAQRSLGNILMNQFTKS